MASKPSVIISAFADEAANYRTALEQIPALAAIGVRKYSPRFIDVLGDGKIEHVVDLNPEKLERLKKYHAQYGVSVSSIGARVGKVKLIDVEDGSGASIGGGGVGGCCISIGGWWWWWWWWW